MASTKNLNGLPRNIYQQFTSTLFYYSKGYMADWIWNATSEKNLSTLTIDIFSKTVLPSELQIKPIIAYLDRLQETIHKELSGNGFETDFIKSGEIQIFVLENRWLTMEVILTDINENIYKSKKQTQRATEKYFKVFDETLLVRIKNFFSSSK